jgi:hypothetical protein
MHLLPEFLLHKFKSHINETLKARPVKGCIPDQIFYPHPHFFPIFCLNLRKKGIENPAKTHPFYKPAEGYAQSLEFDDFFLVFRLSVNSDLILKNLKI